MADVAVAMHVSAAALKKLFSCCLSQVTNNCDYNVYIYRLLCGDSQEPDRHPTSHLLASSPQTSLSGSAWQLHNYGTTLALSKLTRLLTYNIRAIAFAKKGLKHVNFAEQYIAEAAEDILRWAVR